MTVKGDLGDDGRRRFRKPNQNVSFADGEGADGVGIRRVVESSQIMLSLSGGASLAHPNFP